MLAIGILFLCLSVCFFSLFVVRFYFWYHFDQRIAVVTERVDAVAERMDAVDGGSKRNGQVKKVWKSKRACYCRGSRVAEIDKWIADVLKQLANVEDRRVAVFYFLWKYFWCFILTFCKIKTLKIRVFFVQLEQWTNEWMPKRSYQRATIYFYSFYIIFLGWNNITKLLPRK